MDLIKKLLKIPKFLFLFRYYQIKCWLLRIRRQIREENLLQALKEKTTLFLVFNSILKSLCSHGRKVTLSIEEVEASHDELTLKAVSHFSEFFVNETRKNNHIFGINNEIYNFEISNF